MKLSKIYSIYSKSFTNGLLLSVKLTLHKQKGYKMIRLYKLIWNNEIIEEDIATKEEAIHLRNEYSIAYKGNVRIKQYWGEK